MIKKTGPSQFVRLINARFFLLTLVLTACSDPPQQQNMSPPEVTVASPLLREITDWDEYTGRLAAVDEVEVRARVGGYVSSIHFEDGQVVDEGDLLYVIDQRPFTAARAQAAAELTQARLRLELANNDLARAEGLYKTRAISEEEFDARTQNRAVSAAAVQAAEAALAQAALELEFTEVRAPISGRTGDNSVSRGSLISGGNANSTLLTKIVSLDPIHVYFTADERSYLNYQRLDRSGERPSSRVAPNPVRLMVADESGFIHDGVMDFVDNEIDVATGTIQGRAIFDNPDRLLIPGLFARVQLKGRGPYTAVLVPDEAIATDQAQKFVYVVDSDNIASRRTVSLGDTVDGDLRIIKDGLGAEDRIIIRGLQRVRAGNPVTPIDGSIGGANN